MAVQLPNFLAAGIQKPDYSGLSDIFDNYYAGKNMPRQDKINEYQAKGAPLDFLMKQIQAKFAEPNAEAALTGVKLGNQGKSLSNRQMQMTIQKLHQELKNQAEVQAAMQKGASGGGMQMGGGAGVGMGGGMGGGQTPNMMPQGTDPNMMPMGGNSPSMGAQDPSMMPEAPSMMPNAPQAPMGGAEGVRQQQAGTALQKGLMEVMQHQAMKNQQTPMTAPLMEDHPAERSEIQNVAQMPNRSRTQLQEIEAGSPAAYGIDELWDAKPHLRPYIVKQGFKAKEIKPSYDKKSGMMQVQTTWPSGRITVKTIKPEQEEDTGNEIPLSKPTLVKVENETRGIDALLPYMDSLIEMSKPTYIAPGVPKTKLPMVNLMPSNAGVAYRAAVNKGLESFMSASTLPRTDTSIKKVEAIMTRGHGEDDPTYHKRLLADKKEMLEKRAKNIQMLKKGINKFGSNATDNSDEKSNELSGYTTEELKAML